MAQPVKMAPLPASQHLRIGANFWPVADWPIAFLSAEILPAMSPTIGHPIPVVVVSHSTLNALADNSNAHWWNTSPEIALARAIGTFGPNVVIEAGAEMISRLADLGLVDALELSVTDVIDGVQPIDYKKLLAKFSIVSEMQIDSTIFYTATK